MLSLSADLVHVCRFVRYKPNPVRDLNLLRGIIVYGSTNLLRQIVLSNLPTVRVPSLDRSMKLNFPHR